MKYLKIITIGSFFISPTILLTTSASKMDQDGFLSPAARTGATILVEGASDALGKHLPAAHAALADVGKNAGVGAITLAAGYAAQTGASIKAGAVATGAAIKSGAVAAAPYVVPYIPHVAAGVAVAGVGYGAYQAYRHYNPTTEQKVWIINTETGEAEAYIKLKEKQNEQQTLEEQMRTQGELNSCFLEHLTAERNSGGVPKPCESEACACALAGGKSKVDDAINILNQFAPQETKTSDIVPAQTAYSWKKPLAAGVAAAGLGYVAYRAYSYKRSSGT